MKNRFILILLLSMVSCSAFKMTTHESKRGVASNSEDFNKRVLYACNGVQQGNDNTGMITD